MLKQQSAFAARIGGLVFAASAIVATSLPANAQTTNKMLPMEPLHQSGQSVQPSFEGWWQNPDGTFSIMLGYFNRNTQEEVDIPVGPNNKIEPGGPDYGQPTHFLTRRHWGMFALTVPKDFGDKKLTWTLTFDGQTMSVPMSLNNLWNISPMHEIGIGNTPPTISFEESGMPQVQGPHAIIAERTAKVGEPLSLTVWASDDAKSLFGDGAPRGGRGRGGAAAGGGRGGRGGAAAGGGDGAPAAPAAAAPQSTDQLAAAAAAAGIDADTIAQFLPRGVVNLTWSKFRGPGEVTFANKKPSMEKIPDGTIPKKDAYNGKSTTTATFSEPGDYTLLVVANDASGEGGGGFLCCWTNGEVKVTVK